MIFGKVTCNACDALFRPCSFAKTNQSNEPAHFEADLSGFLDTLHVVSEDTCQDRGALTGLKSLKSKGGNSTPARSDDGKSKRSTNRFSRTAVKILRDWLESHADHPYPTEEEKDILEKETGLKQAQISTWLANARRRKKSATAVSGSRSRSPRPSSTGVNIPNAEAARAWSDLNPFERWQHSPPENEPAPIHAIAKAVASSDYAHDKSTSPGSTCDYRRDRSSNESAISARRAPSTTSFDTGISNTRSVASSAVWSHGSQESLGSFGSFSSFGSGLNGKRDRRRRRRGTQPLLRKTTDDAKKRIFQCTFCTDTFRSKYDWTRHEKSVHLSLEKWICAPLGPVITDPATGSKRCVYCNAMEPTRDHLDTHKHSACENKGMESRTFYRKDHLRQHLRLMHGCELTPEMDSWKAAATFIRSRCGFCDQRFTIWQDRNDHLASHFKDGAQMMSWKGCRGLDPEIAAQVTCAMPPYLIGMESLSPVPFSATNPSSINNHMEHMLDGPGQKYEGVTWDPCAPATNTTVLGNVGTTCWEILTVRLGQYAKEMTDKGLVMTDEMLQQQSRRILYDSDDTWNQTAADNPEWLDLFKKAHGLNYLPSRVGGQGEHVPEDLEWYGDLGMRVPFSVQLHRGARVEDCPVGVQQLYSGRRPDTNRQSVDSGFGASTGEAALPTQDSGPGYQRYSTMPLPADKARQFESFAGAYSMRDMVVDDRSLHTHTGNIPLSGASSLPVQGFGTSVANPSISPTNVFGNETFDVFQDADADADMDEIDFNTINFDDFVEPMMTDGFD